MSHKRHFAVSNKYFFKCEEETLPHELKSTLNTLSDKLVQMQVNEYKGSHESGKSKKLFSPVALNKNIKKILNEEGWKSKKIICSYESIDKNLETNLNAIKQFYKMFVSQEKFTKKEFEKTYKELLEKLKNADIQLQSLTKSWKNLTQGFDSYNDKSYEAIIGSNIDRGFYIFHDSTDNNEDTFVNYITKDFVGFREIDFINEFDSNNNVGIEIQFGKYAFMVYNVCAKMKIFERHNLIRYGIEVVPSKKMQKFMSTGVSFFEQFVWDLNQRGNFDEDIPVIVLAIEPTEEGFKALEESIMETSIKKAQ